MSDSHNYPEPAAYRRFFLQMALAGFACLTSMRLCDALLPDIARNLETDLGTAAGAISMFAIAYGVLQLVYGPLGDRYGKQRVILLAVSVSAFINLALAFAPNLSVLLALRFVAGAAAAGIVPLSMAYIGDSIPYERRQHELARLLPATIMGMIFGQWVGGVFADTVGWRAAFVLPALLFGLVAALMAWELRRSPAVHGQTPVNSVAQIGLVLRTPWARRILLAALVEGCLGYGSLVFIPIHLYQHFGLSLTMAGGIVVLYGLGGLGYTFFSRRLVASLGEPGMAICGGSFMAAGFGVLAFAPSWHWAMPACLIAGFGFYLIHNTLQTNATQMVSQARGTAVSLFACSLFLGQSIGVSAIALLIEHHDTTAAFIPSVIALPLLGLWLAWSIKRRR